MITSRQLGQHGPVVSPIGIGTWAWGDRLFWGYGDRYGAAEVEAAFQSAVGAGITFFDTAEVYGMGESERLLGQFCREVSVPVQIATKFGPVPWRFTQSSVLDAVRASLDRLQVETIDLYQVHWPFSFLLGQDALFEALAESVQKGWIRAVGVSNYSADQMQKAHDSLARFGVPLAVNQVRYSLVTRQIEKQGLLERSRRLGVTILAYSPLAQGLLTGKYTPDSPPQGARRFDARFSAQGLAKLAPVLNVLGQCAEAHDKTLGQVALNWLINREGVIPIPGAKNQKQARENAGAMGWSLTPQEWDALDRVTRPWME
ncbi:aldo/keto reductase [Altericista sp. CCNU0014]|uniref:aldo/keto reductase n=1 Tax=Altericista sp. CCNU0014 TaxID=3082949 RepID=UPI00384C4879